jgi:tripartite motif-containing protein 37
VSALVDTDLIMLTYNQEHNVKTLHAAKDARVREIHYAVKLIIARLQSQLEAKLCTVRKRRTSLIQETQLLEALLQMTEHQLNSCTWSELITKSGDLLHMICEMHNKPIESFVTATVPANFQRLVHLSLHEEPDIQKLDIYFTAFLM